MPWGCVEPRIDFEPTNHMTLKTMRQLFTTGGVPAGTPGRKKKRGKSWGSLKCHTSPPLEKKVEAMHETSLLSNKCHRWPFLVCFYSICFLFTVFSILELRCLDSVLVVHLPSLHCAFSIFTTFGIPHLELCCLDSMFLVSFTVFEFSIPILELRCLDSMFLFLFTVCAF